MKLVIHKKIDSRDIVFFLLWIWVFSNCFTAVDSNWLPGLSGTDSVLHIHNVLFILFMCFAFAKRKFTVPKGYLYVFCMFAEMTLIWVFNMNKYGLSSGYVSTLYGMLILICVAAMEAYLDMDMINRIFESVAVLMAGLILLNLFLNIGSVVSSLAAGWSHPDIQCFFGGGHNLEAVWMTMFGVFVREQWRYRYWIFTILLSVIYLSRTGVLVNLILLLIYMFQSNKKSKMKQALLIVCSAVAVLYAINIIGLFDNIWIRFVNTGKESGSVSRINIWKAVIQGIQDRPLGIGCGNAMRFVRETYRLRQGENNAHNIYLQCILENNMIGFLLMMLGWIKIGIQQLKERFSNPCGTFLILYAFQGLFQMQLKEPLLFLALALYLTVPCNNKAIHETEMIR